MRTWCGWRPTPPPAHPILQIIGLPDRALNESRERARSAIVNSGFGFPPGKLLVNLAPADMRKAGSVSTWRSAWRYWRWTSKSGPGDPRVRRLRRTRAGRELRAVPGVLAMTLAAKPVRFARIVVPEANRDEAALIAGSAVAELRRGTICGSVSVYTDTPSHYVIVRCRESAPLSERGTLHITAKHVLITYPRAQ